MPQKVYDRVIEQGVEIKCLEGGPDGPCCTRCRRIIMDAFGFFYDRYDSPRTAIAADLLMEGR